MQTLLTFSGVHQVKTSGYIVKLYGVLLTSNTIYSQATVLGRRRHFFKTFPSEKMVLILPSSTKDGKSAYATCALQQASLSVWFLVWKTSEQTSLRGSAFFP